MSEEIRTPDLSSDRIFRYVEATKVYLLKVTFNLRTLIYHAPKPGKFNRALKRYKKAAEKTGGGLESVPVKTASEMLYQYYRYTNMDDVRRQAEEKYLDYYNDLTARLKRLKKVKSSAKWKTTTRKRKLRLYDEAKDANRALNKDYQEDINRLLFKRAKALGVKKDIIWKEYQRDPDQFEQEIEELLY